MRTARYPRLIKIEETQCKEIFVIDHGANIIQGTGFLICESLICSNFMSESRLKFVFLHRFQSTITYSRFCIVAKRYLFDC
jgi:hypothetical protein